MITETIYEHLKDIYNSKVGPLVSPAIEIDPSFTVSRVIHVLTKNVRTLLGGKDIADMNIRPFQSPIHSLTKDDLVQKAANTIAHYRIRAVPVLENNKIVGCVTAKSILELLSKKGNQWIGANLILTANPITIKSSESLATARRLMLSKKIDHLPVIDKNSVRQVLTSYHVLQTLNPQERIGKRSLSMTKVGNLGARIGNMGSTRIPRCLPTDNLNTIIRSMLDTNTTCCLVSLWDKLQGIITYRDILSLLAAKIESEIPLYVVGFPSNGLIGTFAISYLVYHLKMKQIGEMEHPGILPTLFIENGEIFGPIRVYNKDNLYVIMSDLPFDPELAYDFSESVIEFAKKNNIGKTIIVSGLESPNADPNAPQAYGLVTHQNLEKLLYDNEIPKFISGTIFGTDAVIISAFRASDIPALVLYCEGHPFFPDPEAAVHAITVLSKILKVKIDTTEIKKKLEHLRIQHRNLMQETISALQQQAGKQPGSMMPRIYG